MADARQPENRTASKSRRPRWVAWARDIALLVVALAIIQWWQARDLVVGPAPPLVGHLIDGGKLSRTHMAKDRYRMPGTCNTAIRR